MACAVAVAVTLSATVLIMSFRSLETHPSRFGAPWDLTLGSFGSSEEAATAIAQLQQHTSTVADASEIVVNGSGFTRDGKPFTAVALRSLVGQLEPTLLQGRAPQQGDEIALGMGTMRANGLRIGDQFDRVLLGDGSPLPPLRIVGIAVVNDGLGSGLNRSGLVTASLFDQLGPSDAGSQQIAVRLSRSVPRGAAIADLTAAFPNTVVLYFPQYDILNYARVSATPTVLAVLIAGIAGAAFAQALALSVRGHRKDFAVLRVLGFTQRQVSAAVSCHAAAIAVPGALAGAAIGLVGGRIGWQAIARDLGVRSAADLPALAVCLTILAAVAIANLVALYPGVRAARMKVAETLQGEAPATN
jgi:hypothetical protein